MNDALRNRIADRLGWTVEDTMRFTAMDLRNLMRLHSQNALPVYRTMLREAKRRGLKP